MSDNPKYSQEERRDHKPCPTCGDWHSAMSSPTDFVILKSPLVAALRADLTESNRKCAELSDKVTDLITSQYDDKAYKRINQLEADLAEAKGLLERRGFVLSYNRKRKAVVAECLECHGDALGSNGPYGPKQVRHVPGCNLNALLQKLSVQEKRE